MSAYVDAAAQSGFTQVGSAILGSYCEHGIEIAVMLTEDDVKTLLRAAVIRNTVVEIKLWNVGVVGRTGKNDKGKIQYWYNPSPWHTK